MSWFKRKPRKGQKPYKPCGRPMSEKRGNTMVSIGRCIRPAGHNGGCSNVRTD